MKSKKWIYVFAVVLLLVVAILLFTLDKKLPVTNSNSLATTTIDSTSSTSTTTTAITTTTESVATTTTTPPATSSTTASTTTATKVTKTEAAKVTKTTASKTTATKTTSGKKDYLDTSKLTGTQEDVGKVVGYSNLFQEDIVVLKVKDDFTANGLRSIEIVFSDGNGIVYKIECRYCHGFPCPDGGDKACSEYDVKLDPRITCQQCGCPKGDGHNGTCHRTIDWDNGGKVICHHYD